MNKYSQKVLVSNTLTAFDRGNTIGTAVTDFAKFWEATTNAVLSHDFTKGRVPGQAFISLNEAIPYVSSGVGKRTSETKHFVLRSYRGNVEPFLRREKAEPVESCAIIVYTIAAYLKDPDVMKDPCEITRVTDLGATHILVAIHASAGPNRTPLSPYRLVHNLAGGNNECFKWSMDEVRMLALQSKTYHDEWCVVADSESDREL